MSFELNCERPSFKQNSESPGSVACPKSWLFCHTIYGIILINSCNYGRIDGLIRSYMHNIHTLQTSSVIIIIIIIHNQEKILRSIHKIYIQITGKNSSQPAEFMMRLAE
jgi:hypothetical protein